jgi:hypothetical protein
MTDFGACVVEVSDHTSRVLQFLNLYFIKYNLQKSVHIMWHLLTGHVGATWVC